MPAKKRRTNRRPAKRSSNFVKGNSFAAFIEDPLVATALIVFALIALVLSILEFTSATAK